MILSFLVVYVWRWSYGYGAQDLKRTLSVSLCISLR